MKKYLKLISILIATLLLSGCGNQENLANVNNGKLESNIIESNSDAYVSEVPSTENMEESLISEEISSVDESSVETEVIKSDKLVYNCDLSIQTLEYEKTILSLKNNISKYNGIIESEYETDNDSTWYYYDYEKTSGTKANNIKIRIPVENYEKFLNSLDGTGKIINKSSYVENISRQYYETAATIESLEIQEQRLLDMMKQALTIEDMIAVETRLTEVQTSLNSYKTSLEVMSTDVELSTINISVIEVLEYKEDSSHEKTNTFFDRLFNTLKDTFYFFWDMLEWILFFVIRIIPIAIIMVPLLFVVSKIIKKIKNKKKK